MAVDALNIGQGTNITVNDLRKRGYVVIHRIEYDEHGNLIGARVNKRFKQQKDEGLLPADADETCWAIDFDALIEQLETALNVLYNGERYSTIAKFIHKITWTFWVNTAATDGIRLFFNPLFARDLLDLGAGDAVSVRKEMAAKHEPARRIKTQMQFQLFKHFYFVIIHECYHKIYRHIESAQYKEETRDFKNHDLANISMDDQINRDIEEQYPEFKGCTKASHGCWEAEKYPTQLWDQIFDDKYREQNEPVVPDPFNSGPSGGGGGQQQEDSGDEIHKQAAPDYADGWSQAIADVKSGKVDPHTFKDLPVDRKKFGHKVLGFVNGATDFEIDPSVEFLLSFNQDEWNKGYNDCIKQILQTEQGGGGGSQPGQKVVFDNLEKVPQLGKGGGQQSQNQDDQNTEPGEGGESGQQTDRQPDGNQKPGRGSGHGRQSDGQNQSNDQSGLGQDDGQQNGRQSGQSGQQGQNGGQQGDQNGQGGQSGQQGGQNGGQHGAGGGQSGSGQEQGGQQGGSAGSDMRQGGRQGGESGQSGQQGSQNGRTDLGGQSGQHGSNGRGQNQSGQGQQGQNGSQQGQNGQNGGTQNGRDGQPKAAGTKEGVIDVKSGKCWNGNDVIKKSDAERIAEKEDDDYTGDEKSTTPEQFANGLLKANKNQIQNGIGINAATGRVVAEIDKALQPPLLDWRGILHNLMKNISPKMVQVNKMKKSRFGTTRLDKYVPVDPHKSKKFLRDSVDIFYLVDASGSISDEQIYRAFSEIIGIESAKDVNIHKSAFAYFSVGIKENMIRTWTKDDSTKKKMEMVEHQPEDPSGGTAVNVAVVQVTELPKQYYSPRKPKTLIVVFTDGETDDFAKLAELPDGIVRDLIFVIMNNGAERIRGVFESFEEQGVPEEHLLGIDLSRDLK